MNLEILIRMKLVRLKKQEEDSLRVLKYIFQNTKMMKDSLQYLIPNLHGVLTLMNF